MEQRHYKGGLRTCVRWDRSRQESLKRAARPPHALAHAFENYCSLMSIRFRVNMPNPRSERLHGSAMFACTCFACLVP
jgi:hypothetical protein